MVQLAHPRCYWGKTSEVKWLNLTLLIIVTSCLGFTSINKTSPTCLLSVHLHVLLYLLGSFEVLTFKLPELSTLHDGNWKLKGFPIWKCFCRYQDSYLSFKIYKKSIKSKVLNMAATQVSHFEFVSMVSRSNQSSVHFYLTSHKCRKLTLKFIRWQKTNECRRIWWAVVENRA